MLRKRGSEVGMKAGRLIAVVSCLALVAVVQLVSAPAQAQTESHGRVLAIPMTIKLANSKWSRIFPELGPRSPEISILRVDPATQATHLMIRIPKDFHVPTHWHTGNETHTVLKGDFTISCNGKREVLGRGDFNYVPAKMPHEAWTKDGALLLITVDRAWDVNWVDGPPNPSDMLRGGRDAKKDKIKDEKEDEHDDKTE